VSIVHIIANALSEGSLVALMAFALAIVLYPLKVFHVALAGIYTVSAYALGFATTRLGMHWATGLFITLFVAGLIGIAVELLIYRPLVKKNAPTLTLAISSLAVYFVMVNIIALMFGNQPITSKMYIHELPHGGVVVTNIQLYGIIIGIVIFALISITHRTRQGLAVLALQDNPDLLRICGWDVARQRLLCIIVSSLVGGITASLIFLDRGADPSMGMPVLLNALVVVVATGPGSYRGLFTVAIAFSLLLSFVSYYVSPVWSMGLAILILIIILVLKPNGLFSSRVRVEEIV
jgi:branched-chain amino acid transport system permease protein